MPKAAVIPKNDRKGGAPYITARPANMTNILVGPSKEVFTIHTSLLSQFSPLFLATLTRKSTSAASATFVMKNADPIIFKFFVHWLYHQRLPDDTDIPELLALWSSDSENMAAGQHKTHNLIHLYVFCDKNSVSVLKRTLMDVIFDHVEEENVEYARLPHRTDISFAFKNMHRETPLCQFLVNAQCNWAGDCAWEDFDADDWAPEFLQGVLMEYTGHRERSENLYACDYHEHKGWEERRACKFYEEYQ